MSENKSSIITPETIRQADDKYVIAVLEALRIPYQSWDRDQSTKVLEKFLEDWHLGKIIWDPELTSNIIEEETAVVTVIWEINGFRRELHEKYREFKNGDKPKHHGLPGSLAETLKYSETALTAALRAIKEKLGQTKPSFKDPSRFRLIAQPVNRLDVAPSTTFKGFMIKKTYWPFICLVDEHLYEEEYSYQEPDKTTYWHWVDIPTSK